MNKEKSRIVATILSFFFGIFGADRFYLGYTALGVVKLLTVGGCGIWWLVDFLRITIGNLGPAYGYYTEDGAPETPKEAAAADAIRECYSLFKSGAITEAEYETKKAELLKEL